MTTTKKIEKMAAQGDVLFRRVERVPDGYALQDRTTMPIIVAHSETGHHHTVPGVIAALYTNRADPLVSYLHLDGDTEVTHHRPYDTHAPILLGGGAGAVWQVRRQREHTPEGWRRVED